MSGLDVVLVALGRGDRLKGARLAALALMLSIPVYAGLVITLALGGGQ